MMPWKRAVPTRSPREMLRGSPRGHGAIQLHCGWRAERSAPLPTLRSPPMKRTKPPFRADHVGSLLRTAPVKEAREKRERGEIDAAALKEVEDREIEKVIKKQEEVGLQAVTDGEFRRSWWHLDFLWGLDGIERYQMGQGIAFAGMRTRAEGARAVGKVGFSGHPMLEHFAFVKSRTTRTAK